MMDNDVLIIVVDFEKGVVGSRTVSNTTASNEDECDAYLRREFAGFHLDDVLFVNYRDTYRSPMVYKEWFNHDGRRK